MSDTDLRDLLRGQREHEPAFLLDPASTIRAGRRRRHLRQGVAAVAVVGVLGAAGALALPDGSGGAGRQDVTGAVATPPPPTDATSDAAAAAPGQPLADQVAAVAAEAYTDVPGAGAPTMRIISPAGEVTASDPTAQSFLAQVDAGDRVLLVVRLGRPVDGVGPDGMCESGPELYLSCDDSVRADGSYVLETVGRSSAPGADGTFRMYPPSGSKGVPSEVFFRRTVVLETPDGNVTAVDEFTRAATLAEAEGEWVLSAQELAALAADPGLAAYDLPHEPWH